MARLFFLPLFLFPLLLALGLYNLDVFEHDVDVPMALYGSIPFVTAVHADDSAAASAASGLLVVNPSEGFVRVERKNAADAETWWAFAARLVQGKRRVPGGGG